MCQDLIFNVLLFNITKCPNVQKNSEKIWRRAPLRPLRYGSITWTQGLGQLLFPLNVKNKFGCVDEKKIAPLRYGSTSRTKGQGHFIFGCVEGYARELRS